MLEKLIKIMKNLVYFLNPEVRKKTINMLGMNSILEIS